MENTVATLLIKNTFTQSFDENRFRNFAINLLNKIDESKAFSPVQGQYIKDAFKNHIRQYKRIGTYTDPEGLKIDVMIVYLHRESALDHARTMQRNFMVDYLKNRDQKDAALVAYVGEDKTDWRFSLVRMEYKTIQTESGKVKVKEDFTPARRYSFLVGENEPNHTAQVQLLPILADSQKNPTLDKLETAFNIESVTKEFFDKYKELFLQLKDELDGIAARDKTIQAEFARCGIDTAAFAKKLLGQIVFLYFLQKKGWMGVQQEKDWGTGSKNFLFDLFDKKFGNYQNFFHDMLEPLFYKALAVERKDNLYTPLNCRIPFLNGGLFEPVGGYEWEKIQILIADKIFKTIFETFNLYNFTVREDEPLEREVAVDPEMLGKVFENLLEIKDRKSKGAFYTPREIVHYMCQESLINYLDTTLNIHQQKLVQEAPEQRSLFVSSNTSQKSLTTEIYTPVVPHEDIETFIHHGEVAVDFDAAKGSGTNSYSWKLPESIRCHAEEIDHALANIKICDPAIGSGAFPLGMMSEIIKARGVLSKYLPTDVSRTAYSFKRHAIENSIYGVDIEPSAVDIARLRLWLSLVVDEEDFRSIKPLPNLDYKIVCGNSLQSVKQGYLKGDIEVLKSQFINETNHEKKQAIKLEIDNILDVLTQKSKTFDFYIYFSEVFKEKNGFDILIANPPYIDSETMTKDQPELRNIYTNLFKSAKGNWDIFVVFIEKGLQILSNNGTISNIVPNKLIGASYSESLREIMSLYKFIEIRDYSEVRVFKDADVYPVVFVLNKSSAKCDVRMTLMKSLETSIRANVIPSNLFYNDIYWDRYFVDDNDLKVILDLSKNPKLEKFFPEIVGAATVSEAYEIKGKIFELSKQTHPFKKLINTGTIDPYAIFWGIRSTQYIKDSYMYPIIFDSDLRSISPTRFKQSNSQKIVIGGLTKRLEGYLDNSECLAGKSTTIILPSLKYDLRLALAVINSRLITYWYQIFYKSLSLAGGYLRINNKEIRTIPFAEKLLTEGGVIISLVDEITARKRENPNCDTSNLEEEIDNLIFQIYEISDSSIKLIKNTIQ